ncbi:MAG: hypothetical protein LQ343_004585 [Gyalolechia ehrenbergii]|nr:MAG: hypothetical protein LQ343_004585 [Gyalolechia ehrenbergii]
MARPFDDHMTSNGGASIYSTAVAANRAWDTSANRIPYPASVKYDEAGQSLSITGTSAELGKKQKGLPLTKIKSPSHGALAAARSAPHQGKVRGRGRSASEATGPATSLITSSYTPVNALPGINAASATQAKVYPMAPPKTYVKTKEKIKPLLRKMSSHDQNTVDLSRSAAEHEGLGIFTSSTVSDSRDPSANISHVERGYHNRTVSGNSLMATATNSSHHGYGMHYVHPMRQTPKPYTPPIASSFANSLESGSSTGTPFAVPSDHIHLDQSTQHINTNPIPYAPLPSPSRVRPPLHIRTGSGSRVINSSQTNLPITPSSLRQKADNPEIPIGMASTRTSFDSMFRKRSRANTNEDPVVRAAQVAILRKEFDERERMKDETRREQEARKAQKEAKRQQKRDESQQRKSESQARKSNAMSEKSAIRAFRAQQETMSRQTTGGEDTGRRPQTRGSMKTAGGAGKAVMNKWQLFVFWFKTLLLRMKRVLTGKSG